MSGVMIAGLVLVVLGAIALAIPWITTSQTRDVANIGDLKLQTTETTTYAIPPLASGGAVVVGLVLLGAGMLRRG